MCRFSSLFAEWSVVHGKCFNCKLYPRCVHTEISTIFIISLSYLSCSSSKSRNECNEKA